MENCSNNQEMYRVQIRKVAATVPSSSVIAATVQQPVSPPVVTTTAQVADSDNPDWTYDPNEPRYCICNQVSYGDMVACDNSDVRSIAYLFNTYYECRTNLSFLPGIAFLECFASIQMYLYIFSVPSNGSIIRVSASLHHQRENGTVLSAHLP